MRISPVLVREIVNASSSPNLGTNPMLEATVGAMVSMDAAVEAAANAAADDVAAAAATVSTSEPTTTRASGIPVLVVTPAGDSTKPQSAAEAVMRSRSLSQKRSSDGEERSRSESLKRTKMDPAIAEEIKRNYQILLKLGLTYDQQKGQFRSATGSALIAKQKATIEWMKGPKNPDSGRKGGKK